jgi:site-specific recombinase XerD
MKNLELFHLWEQVKTSMLTFGFSAKTLEYYEKVGFQPLCSYFLASKQEEISLEALYSCVFETRNKYEEGKISSHDFSYLRKTVSMIEEVYSTGKLVWKELPNWKVLNLNAYFTDILNNYINTQKKKGIYADSTLEIYKYNIYQFLDYLDKNGHQNFSSVIIQDVSNFILYISKKLTAGMQGMMTAMRSFCKFLDDKNFISINMLSIFQYPVAPRRKVIFGFTKEEADAIINAIDKNTPIGKRDYAIILLALKTGLRSIDLVNLQFSNISWKNEEIHIVQRKTNRPLVLPLEPAVGNAIYEYLFNGRPKSKSPHIFIRMIPPYQKLSDHTSSLRSMLCTYMNLAGVSYNPGERKGFHSFRRSLGTWMLENEIPLETIKQVLGHSSIDSSKPYLSTNLKKLKSCSLNFEGIELKREELK